jgi:hypothetical protein
MTDIEQKALALLNEVSGQKFVTPYTRLPDSVATKALCRAIEHHKAFKQEVSDAVEIALLDAEDTATIRNNFSQFIIPKPKPDPLVEVLGAVDADRLRAALKARGLEIREKGQ